MGTNAVASGMPARQPSAARPADELVPEVAIRFWPEQAPEIAELGMAARACLILVGPAIEPPSVLAGTHDWLRIPADEVEVTRRVAELAARVRRTT